MSQDQNSSFDFKAQAKSLLKSISPGSGSTPNPGLALAAVEAALREAFARGRESAGTVRTGSRSGAKPAQGIPQIAQKPTAAPAEELDDCQHEWEETFLDGRALGFRCPHCGILQSDLQNRCNHYFVQVKGDQICVACRKTKKRNQ